MHFISSRESTTRFTPQFRANAKSHGRLGYLTLPSGTHRTPLLFPVVALITGSTPKGGGLWKYILHANGATSLFNRQVPLMTQALHFLDFTVTPRVLNEWRASGMLERYKDVVDHRTQINNSLFIDSGGFKLLWSDNVDLSAFNLHITPDSGPKIIYDLQQDFGGDIIATLDYPLPPGIAQSEAEERMELSSNNAIAAARLVNANGTSKPFLHIAAHGFDERSICEYTKNVFRKLKAEGLDNSPIGIAIGSLVPLRRGTGKTEKILEIVRGVKSAIPRERVDITPIHVFGVTGNLIPVLAYMGVDTFDSSTYVQQARSLMYFDAYSHRYKPVLEINKWQCRCAVCSNLDYDELHQSLTSAIRNKKQSSGHFKSKYYADIALHNLEMDFKLVSNVSDAIQSCEMPELLAEHGSRHNSIIGGLSLLAQSDQRLNRAMTNRSFVLNPSRPNTVSKQSVKPEQAISLRWKPTDFDISQTEYRPPKNKPILLIIPCTGDKPYSKSRSHRLINERLSYALGSSLELVHKVTLSGLYGPVPEEQENEEAVSSYDFRLDISNTNQINLVAARVAAYVQQHQHQYSAVFGYVTNHAYRVAMEKAAKQESLIVLLPAKPKSKRLTEFYRQENVESIILAVKDAVDSYIVESDR